MRAQVVVLRELFAFAMGIVLMLGVAYIFSSNLAPNVEKYSTNELTYSTLYKVHSMLEQVNTLSRGVSGSVISFKQVLPADLNGFNYRLYVDGDNLCLITRGGTIINTCIKLAVDANVSGNFISGSDILIGSVVNDSIMIINFTNYIPVFAPVYFYIPCGAGEVVSWSGYVSFSYDDLLTCGCAGPYYTDYIANPSFETGDLSSWTTDIPNPSIQSINANYDTASDGDYSVLMVSNDANPDNQLRLYQGIEFFDEGNISFYVNSYSNSSSSLSFTSILAQFPYPTNRIIFYITHSYGLSGAGVTCNDFHPLYPFMYIYCLEGVPEREWTEVIIDPINDFKNIFGVDLAGYTFGFFLNIGGITDAYFDNIRVIDYPNGEYCDVGNDGLADGVCYYDDCVSTYLYDFLSNDYLFNENPLVSAPLRNFNASASCRLTVDEVEHPMIVSGSNAYYSFDNPLSRGFHSANITCYSNNVQSVFSNLSVSILKDGWFYDNSSVLETVSGLYDVYSFTGDFTSDPGDEIFVYDNDVNFKVFSSSGSYLGIINITTPVYGCVVDIDDDSANEVVIIDYNLIYVFEPGDFIPDSTFVLDGGIICDRAGAAVVDVNNSFAGKEVLINDYHLKIYNSSGSLIAHTYNESGTPSDSFFSSKIFPVVADINPTIPGLEILFTEPGVGLYLFKSDGATQLAEFPFTGSAPTFVSPAVGEVNNTQPGFEVVTAVNSTPTVMSIYLLNSNLEPLWNYDYTFNVNSFEISDSEGDARPVWISIGDVTGDGNNNIIVSVVNRSNFNRDHVNDDYLIFHSNGSLLSKLTTAAHDSKMPVLVELDPLNPGLEIVSAGTDYLRIINWTGGVLFEKEVPFLSGCNDFVISYNNKTKLIDLPSGHNAIVSYDSLISSDHNTWLNLRYDLNNTGWFRNSSDLGLPMCGGYEVVNWDNHEVFLETDTLTCGCSSRFVSNYLTNPGFETGDLSGWGTLITNPSSQYIEVNNTNVHSGIYSLYLNSTDGNPGNHLYAYQNISLSNELTFNFYGSNNPLSFSAITVTFNDSGVEKSIYYMLYASPEFLYYCGNYPTPDIYSNCPWTFIEDEWTSITFNPVIDGINIWGINPETTSMTIGPRIGGSTALFVDDLVATLSTDSKYCDKDNDLVADGVCYNNTCSDHYLGSLNTNDEYLINENPYFSASLIHFGSSTSCNLNFNDTDYEMSIDSEKTYYALTSYLTKGAYEINISCTSNTYQSIKFNVTSDIIKVNKTFSNFTGIRDNQWFHTVGEISSDYPGKELFIIARQSELFSDHEFLQIYSNQGEFINLIPPGVNDYIRGLAVIDVNNDGNNEIVIRDENNVLMYNKSLDLLWTYSTPGNYIRGLTVSDINDSFAGLEILAPYNKDLYVLNSTGDLLWYFDAPEGGYSSSIPVNPVVADINPTNPGLEVLFPSSDKIYLLTSAGELLYEYATPFGISMTPSVAEINSSMAGLEIAYVNASVNDANQYLLLLNSTLGELWNYTFLRGTAGTTQNTDNNVQSIAIGDVTGDGDKEVLYLITNYTEDSDASDQFLNDHLLIFNKNGELLQDKILNSRWNGLGLSLAEVDNNNPGLEIITGKANTFMVINYTGHVLYSNIVGYVAGQVFIIDDIDGDGDIELINFDNNELVTIRDGITSATNNVWLTFNHDYNRTGYQD